MKKLTLSILIVLILTGCSSKGLKEDKVLYTINGVETKDSDFYQSMKNGDDGTIVINSARKAILENVEIDQDDLDKKIDANIKELEDIFGDKLLGYIQSFGFNSIEDFIDKQVRPSLVIEVLAISELESQKDSLISKYKYKDVEYIATSNKEFLEQALVTIATGTEMKDIKLDETSKYTKETHTKASEVASKTLNKYLKDDQKEGVSGILYDEESNLYFIINNIAVDLDNNLDAVIDTIIAKENYIASFSGTLFKDNGFKVYDKDLKERMKQSYSQYLD